MKLRDTGVIWQNGEFLPWSRATVHVATHAMHYASSVFEGLRTYATPRGTAILQLDPHVRRLIDSCRVVGMEVPWSEAQLREAIVECVRRNGYSASYIRPLVYRGYGQLGVDPTNCPVEAAIIVIEHGAHFGADALERGIDMCVSTWRRIAPDTLPALAKSAANYVNSQLILLEARNNGYTDGIALDAAGFISEGSGANVFLVQRGVLLTPDLGSSILAGITRGCVLQLARDLGLEVREGRLPREMLTISDEIFITGTAAEITPVRSIDKRPIGCGARGPVTERLQRAFRDVIGGEREDRHGWLCCVNR
jgi:branched-chain amino acid aminotransferase